MALKIYNTVDPSEAFSIDGTFTNPLATSLDGTTGEVVQKKYFVRNDDNTLYYTSLTVQPIDGGDNIVSGTGITAGYMWQMIAGDTQPLEAQWNITLAVPGAAISLDNIGSVSDGDVRSYLPFWLRITIPQGVAIESYQEVALKISATEGIVV